MTREAGIALIVVLWVLALLSMIAASVIVNSRTGISLARNQVEIAKAQALAEAGVYRALLGLSEPDPEQAWRVDGTVYAWIQDDAEIRVLLRDEGGKLNLNKASDRLLTGLFRSGGLSKEDADTMVARIADYRDADDLRRLNGGEGEEYNKAGLKWNPKNKPFEALAELRQVLGMTTELYQRVAPALTLYTGRQAPFEPTAPPEVRAFYGTMDSAGEMSDEEGPIAGLHASENDGSGALTDSPQILEQGLSDLRSDEPVYTVHAEAITRDGAVFAREAIVRQTGRASPPFQFLEWKRGARMLFKH